MHPYIYLSPTPGGGQRGLDDLRQGIRDSLAGEAWYRLYAQAEADLDAEPLAAGQLQPASPEDLMPHLPPAGSAIGGRILRGALAWQITGTEAFATCAAEQIDALWADPHGPAWRGEQVGSLPAACALADGVFASAVGLDWLWESLNPAGRQRWMAELGARVLEPFVAAGPGALDELGLFGRAAVSGRGGRRRGYRRRAPRFGAGWVGGRRGPGRLPGRHRPRRPGGALSGGGGLAELGGPAVGRPLGRGTGR